MTCCRRPISRGWMLASTGSGFSLKVASARGQTRTRPPLDALMGAIVDAEALVVCQGAPMIDARILPGAPKLRLVGELLGDRFARRLDVETLREASLRVVDTTNGGSYPVAEWALALMLNCGLERRRAVPPPDRE